ncbi:MAG: class I SAM-dependent methyltransferase [Thermincolia bacterium]
MSKKNKCPLCGSLEIKIFLTRREVPVHQNLVMGDRQRALNIIRGDLQLTHCKVCGFVFNQGFQPEKLCYGEDYKNKQTCSPFFNEYTEKLLGYLINKKRVQNCRVLEVGCGDGSFLRKLIQEGGNTGFGFDPSYTGSPGELVGRLKYFKTYYGPDYAHIPADVVICRHVIEHVPDPLGLLRAMRQALVNSSQARIFAETPCVEWILGNLVIWDFFYEHCSYFNAGSLATAFEISGFNVEGVSHLFGGQYLWIEATVSVNTPLVTKKPKIVPQLAETYSSAENELVAKWQKKLEQMANKGKIAIWGAGAKGVTFANLMDPACKWIDCVVDLNPEKQGRYLPGTGHPIINYPDLQRRGVKAIVIMNPNYHGEIMALLEKAQLKIQLVM